jgi:uncharacterized protein YkwD
LARFTFARRLACLALIAASPLLSGSLGPQTNLNERLLASHNRERSALGLPALRWSADLAAGAQNWADYLASTGRFEHSPDSPKTRPLGENIWGGTTGRFQPEEMVGRWIAEKSYFKPGVFPNNSRSGRVQDVSHYTQVIWKSSSEVGCAVSRGREEDLLVCRYSAPGNVLGSHPL